MVIYNRLSVSKKIGLVEQHKKLIHLLESKLLHYIQMTVLMILVPLIVSVKKNVASSQQLKKLAHFVSQFYKPSLLLAWSLTSGCLVSYHVLLHPLFPSVDQGAARGSGFYIYVI